MDRAKTEPPREMNVSALADMDDVGGDAVFGLTTVYSPVGGGGGGGGGDFCLNTCM